MHLKMTEMVGTAQGDYFKGDGSQKARNYMWPDGSSPGYYG
jgi:hypothetical protein